MRFCEHCGTRDAEIARRESICSSESGEHSVVEGTARERADALVLGMRGLLTMSDDADEIVEYLHDGRVYPAIELLSSAAHLQHSCANYLKGDYIEECIEIIGRAYS